VLTTNNAIIAALDGRDLSAQEIMLAIAHSQRKLTLGGLVTDHLSVMAEEDYVYLSAGLWGLSWKGKEKLAKMQNKPVKTSTAGKAYRPELQYYQGEELKATCPRLGAYDFLLCKSMVNGVLKDYRTAHLHEGAHKA
jgi:hypothetical protein